MLSNLLDKIKSYQYPLFLALCIGLISFISYNLGRINANDKVALKIGENTNLKAEIFEAASNTPTPSLVPQKKLDTRVVVSKASSTKKYHYTWCPGAKQIKEENKVWFNSDKEAETAGYTLAGNCTK